MSLQLHGPTFLQELEIMADVCGKYLEAGNSAEIRRVKALLQATLAGAAGNTVEFDFKLTLQSRISQRYKGAGLVTYRPLYGTLRVDFKCKAVDPATMIVLEGVNVITLLQQQEDDSTSQKTLHLDVCHGGFSNQSGHPPFHSQFHGFVNDIPRLPCFLVYPLDALEFLLMELFQADWREHLGEHATKTRLRGFPSRQRERFKQVLHRWISAIERGPESALISLQHPFAPPIHFH